MSVYGHVTANNQANRGTSMAEGAIEFLKHPATFFSAAELAKAIGADFETINNWVRRGMITRARIGGRQLRSRLFSTEDVYKAALTNELVKLGLAPSSASGAVNELWERWDKREVEGRKIYGVLVPSDEGWSAMLCWQPAGGPLYKLAKSSRSHTTDEYQLPERAIVVIPISSLLADVTKRLMELLGEAKEA
jgi:MerR HTH family regulatory protein